MNLHTWRFLASYVLGSLAFVALGAWGMWYFMLPRVTPYYIEVNTCTHTLHHLGATVDNFGPPLDAVQQELARFIHLLRRVSPNKEAMARDWVEVFHHVTPRGAETLRAYMAHEQPLAPQTARAVEVGQLVAVTPVTGHAPITYYVEWIEILVSDGGAWQAPQGYSGEVSWVHRAPQSAAEIAQNVLGVYIDTWTITKEQ